MNGEEILNSTCFSEFAHVAIDLLQFANKYDIKDTQEPCQAVIAKNITLESVTYVLEVAHRCGATILKNSVAVVNEMIVDINLSSSTTNVSSSTSPVVKATLSSSPVDR